MRPYILTIVLFATNSMSAAALAMPSQSAPKTQGLKGQTQLRGGGGGAASTSHPEQSEAAASGDAGTAQTSLTDIPRAAQGSGGAPSTAKVRGNITKSDSSEVKGANARNRFRLIPRGGQAHDTPPKVVPSVRANDARSIESPVPLGTPELKFLGNTPAKPDEYRVQFTHPDGSSGIKVYRAQTSNGGRSWSLGDPTGLVQDVAHSMFGPRAPWDEDGLAAAIPAQFVPRAFIGSAIHQHNLYNWEAVPPPGGVQPMRRLPYNSIDARLSEQMKSMPVLQLLGANYVDPKDSWNRGPYRVQFDFVDGHSEVHSYPSGPGGNLTDASGERILRDVAKRVGEPYDPKVVSAVIAAPNTIPDAFIYKRLPGIVADLRRLEAKPAR
jgi:hypothetical protein